MEVSAALCLLLVAVVTAEPPFCDPVEAVEGGTPWIRAQRDMGPGCWSSFSNGSRDVHVLHLLPGNGLVAINLTAARPAELIISCDSDMTIFFYHNRNVTIHSSRRCNVMGAAAVPFHFDDLLSRVVEEFGGVSSFTTLTGQEPITFTGHTAPGGGSVECTPKSGFFPEDYILVYGSSPPMSFCSLDHNASEREVHVIVIPDDVEIRNVSIGFLSQQKITLVLKGPNGTLWTIPAPPDQLSILCSNQFLLPGFLAAPNLHYVKDSAPSFWNNVQLKVGNITSYTEIRGGGSSLRLVIGSGDRSAPEPRPSAAEPAAGPWPPRPQTPRPPRPQTPLQLQLSDGPDHRTPLPSAQITPGSMIYANVSSQNRPLLTLAVTGCRVRSCPATRELLLVTQSCSSFSCLLVLSLPLGPDQRWDQWQEQPSPGWVLECTVQLCSDVGGKADCEARSAVRNVEVLGSSPRPESSAPPEPCLDFGLSAVLGIAFGGFLIGILFTGALWFIQVRTGRSRSVSKRLPVPGNPTSCPASCPTSCGDSSSSPSLGSTKSTPTSSRA